MKDAPQAGQEDGEEKSEFSAGELWLYVGLTTAAGMAALIILFIYL